MILHTRVFYNLIIFNQIKQEVIVDLILMMIWGGVILTVRLVNNSADTFRIILYGLCIAAFLVSLTINIIKYRKLKKEL